MPNDDRVRVEIAGKIHTIMQGITVGAKATPKVEIWLQLTPDGAEWPQVVPVEFFGRDKAAIAGALRPGSTVKIACEIRGRVWKDRCFVSLAALDVIEGADAGPVDEAGPADAQDDGPPPF